MLAVAFLKTDDGNFDVAALALLVATMSAGLYGLIGLIPKALRERKIRFTNAGPYISHGAEFFYERARNPVKFWIAIVLFTLVSIGLIALGILISFGIQRKW
jgi:hypothetical protein